WAVLASYMLFGVHESAVRIPGALAAIGTLLYVFRIADLLFGRGAALVAAAVLCTTARFFVLARKLPIDILLLFFLTATACHLLKGLKDGSRAAWLLAGLFAGLGFLAKGPVAWLIPAGSCLLAMLWTRRWSVSWRQFVPAAVIAAAVAAPWYWLVYQRHGWAYITPFFTRDNFARFATESFGPSRGPLYYPGVYLVDFFPWSILGLVALYWFWQERKVDPELRTSAFALPVTWCALVMVFFSLSRNKQEYYIAPIYPMMAVLIGGAMTRVGAALQGVPAWAAGRRVWRWSFLAMSLLMLALAAILLFALPVLIPDLPPALAYLPSAGLFLASLAPLTLTARSGLRAGFLTTVVPLYCLYLAAALWFVPAVEPLRPVRELCGVLAEQALPGDPVGYYRVSVPSMVFYLRRPIFEELDPDAMVRRFRGPERVFCILPELEHNYFVGRRDLVLYVLDRRPRLITSLEALLDENERVAQELLLVSNRPPGETGEIGAAGIP
ncbi:MAG: glycosyltransferase family 39 protein, partial [Acidobacteriota bacterium]